MEGELFSDSEATQTSFVYDKRSGAIVHIHQFIPAAPDGTCPTDEMEEMALRLAPSGLDRKGLGVLHRGRDLKLNPEYNYQIDVESGRLIEEPAPSNRIAD